MGPRASKQRFKDTASAAKGSGWKTKQGVLYRQVEEWFIAAHLRTAESGDGFVLLVEVMAKPMLIDPLYWYENDLGYNIRQPLSFRYWGSFICGTPVVATRVVDAETSEGMAQLTVETANDLLPDVMHRLKTEDFLDIASAPLGIHDNFRMGATVLYARRLREDPDRAKSVAKELATAPPAMRKNDYRLIGIEVGGGDAGPSVSSPNTQRSPEKRGMLELIKKLLRT